MFAWCSQSWESRLTCVISDRRLLDAFLSTNASWTISGPEIYWSRFIYEEWGMLHLLTQAHGNASFHAIYRMHRKEKKKKKSLVLVVFQAAIFVNVTLPFSYKEEKRKKSCGGVHKHPGQRRRRTLAVCSCSFQRRAFTGSRGTDVVKYALFVFSSHTSRGNITDVSILQTQ